MRATIIYTLQRAVLFVAPFAILMVAQVPWYLSLVVALVFAFCASYVFLRGSRDAAIAELERARARRQGSDEDVEDAARDAKDPVDGPAAGDEGSEAPGAEDAEDAEDAEADDAETSGAETDEAGIDGGAAADDPDADDESAAGTSR